MAAFAYDAEHRQSWRSDPQARAAQVGDGRRDGDRLSLSGLLDAFK